MSNPRPTLFATLDGPNANVYMVIAQATQLLSGQPLAEFTHDISTARQEDAGKVYEDILEIINCYVRLIDVTGTYPQYSWNRAEIMVAINHLNDQLDTLPDDLCCLATELLPEFDSTDCGPDSYLALVEEEIERVQREIKSAEADIRTSEGQIETFEARVVVASEEIQRAESEIVAAETGRVEPYQRLEAMLQACAEALRAAGV